MSALTPGVWEYSDSDGDITTFTADTGVTGEVVMIENRHNWDEDGLMVEVPRDKVAELSAWLLSWLMTHPA